MSFIASFPGDCENCETPIEEGDRVKMLDYEKKLIAHVTCPPLKVKLGEVTCSKCWLVHAGDCF